MKTTFTLLISIITIACFSQAGMLDRSFGNNGKALVNLGKTNQAYFRKVKILQGRNILGVGFNLLENETGEPLQSDILLAEYLPDGNLDSSFGVNGIVQHNLGGYEFVYDAVIQKDNKILICGFTEAEYADYPTDMFVARYKPNGKIDSAFGKNGVVIIDINVIDKAYGLLLQNDEKIIVIGYTSDISNFWKTVLIRYNRNGSIDSSFGVTGKVYAPGGVAVSGLIQPNGKIIVAGADNVVDYYAEFFCSRYLPDGNIDSSFANNGIGFYSIYGGSSAATSCAFDKRL